MNHHTFTRGFSAVELLITLFVAAAFLLAGYQLFNVVIRDGGNTRTESAAGNVAYDYLRRYSESATNPCAPSTPLSSTPVAVAGTKNSTVSISVTCPMTDAPAVSKVEAIVQYGIGSDANTVKIATFVDKSQGTPPSVGALIVNPWSNKTNA